MQPLCVPCQRLMTCSKNGVVVAPAGNPEHRSRGDQYTCQSCGHQVISGHGPTYHESIALKDGPDTFIRFQEGRPSRLGLVPYEIRMERVNGEPHVNILHVEKHSPDGFEWGYGGSGPADLARSILLQFVSADVADANGLYQEFKREFIEPMPEAGGRIWQTQVLAWLHRRRIWATGPFPGDNDPLLERQALEDLDRGHREAFDQN